MHHPHRSGLLRRSALVASLLGALPLSLIAQVRRPDPLPTARRAPTGVPKRRAEVFATVGTQAMSTANALKSSMVIGELGFRRQYVNDWLFLGGIVDLGSSTVNGEYFPFEKRLVGDTTNFVSVDGSARFVSARFTADAIVPIADSKRARYGGGVNAGLYAVMPSPGNGADAGMFIAPTVGVSGMAAYDLTPKFGVIGRAAITQFLGFKRDKIRPSDSALEDPVFVTPFDAPPAAKSSFGGLRITVGITYRLGVKTVAGGAKK